MQSNTNDDFLIGIHKKINRKKRQHSAIRMAVSLVVTIIVTFQASTLIHQSEISELAAAVLQNGENIPDYDALFQISDDQAVNFLIDEMDMYDLLQIAEDDFQTSDLIESIIKEG